MTKKQALELAVQVRMGYNYREAREIFQDKEIPFTLGIKVNGYYCDTVAQCLESLAYSYNGDIA